MNWADRDALDRARQIGEDRRYDHALLRDLKIGLRRRGGSNPSLCFICAGQGHHVGRLFGRLSRAPAGVREDLWRHGHHDIGTFARFRAEYDRPSATPRRTCGRGDHVERRSSSPNSSRKEGSSAEQMSSSPKLLWACPCAPERQSRTSALSMHSRRRCFARNP